MEQACILNMRHLYDPSHAPASSPKAFDFRFEVRWNLPRLSFFHVFKNIPNYEHGNFSRLLHIVTQRGEREIFVFSVFSLKKNPPFTYHCIIERRKKPKKSPPAGPIQTLPFSYPTIHHLQSYKPTTCSTLPVSPPLQSRYRTCSPAKRFQIKNRPYISFSRRPRRIIYRNPMKTRIFCHPIE